MSVLIAVAKDLFDFATGALFGIGAMVAPKVIATEKLAEPPVPHPPAEKESSFRSAAEIIDTTSLTPSKNTVMYAGGDRTPLHTQPTQVFDGVVMYIPFGGMVMLLENRGRWSRVVYQEHQGWVLREDLVDRAAHVYPHFKIGEANELDDPNTLRIRALLADEYGAAAAGLPLQSEEYVHYRLFRKGISIPWGSERPRTAGRWASLLRGKSRVHQHVAPKTGDIMEYENTDGTGHLVFVEAVAPDETITVSEANFASNGIYNERLLTAAEWQALAPVFMTVT